MKRFTVSNVHTLVYTLIILCSSGHLSAEDKKNACEGTSNAISRITVALGDTDPNYSPNIIPHDVNNTCRFSVGERGRKGSLSWVILKDINSSNSSKKSDLLKVYGQIVRDNLPRASGDSTNSCDEAKKDFRDAHKEYVNAGGSGGLRTVEKCNQAIDDLADEDAGFDDKKESYGDCPGLAKEHVEDFKEKYDAIEEKRDQLKKDTETAAQDGQDNIARLEEELLGAKTAASESRQAIETFDAASSKNFNEMKRTFKKEMQGALDALDGFQDELIAVESAYIQKVEEIKEDERNQMRECAQKMREKIFNDESSKAQQAGYFKSTGKNSGGSRRTLKVNQFFNQSGKSRVQYLNSKYKKLVRSCMKDLSSNINNRSRKSKSQIAKYAYKRNLKRIEQRIARLESKIIDLRVNEAEISFEAAESILAQKKKLILAAQSAAQAAALKEQQLQKEKTNYTRSTYMNQNLVLVLEKDYQGMKQAYDMVKSKSSSGKRDEGSTNKMINGYYDSLSLAVDAVEACGCCLNLSSSKCGPAKAFIKSSTGNAANFYCPKKSNIGGGILPTRGSI